jgi:Calcineurin-like phosphoesterase
MRVKEGSILFLFFILVLTPLLIVIIAEVSQDNSYENITRYPIELASSPLRFHVIGDFGDLAADDPINNTDPVIFVSDIMQRNAKERPISMIISVGDNTYNHAYAYFDQTAYNLMYNVFDKPTLQGKPWYLVLGNHDCEIDPMFEVEATKLYPMWNMPARYYNFSYPIDSGYYIGLTFLDGCILTNDPENSDNTDLSEAQYAWLRQVLSDQNNDPSILWKFVTVHMPLWSPGNGHGDSETLKQLLYPILYEYNVDLVLCGHEHIMAHYASMNANGPQPYVPLPNINYTYSMDEYLPYNRASDWIQGQAIHEVLQGAGGRDLYQVCPYQTTAMADLLWTNPTFGFTEMYVDSSIIVIQYYNLTEPLPLYTVRINSKLN